MPLLKNDQYTSEDYWNLPEGTRAELIDGKLYDMAPPSRIHQQLVMELAGTIREYIKRTMVIARYIQLPLQSTLTPMIKTG